MRRWLSCLVLVGSFAVAGEARAIGACRCNDQPFAMPTFTRTMPLNARIFASLRGAAPATLRLLQDTREIPIAVEPAGEEAIHVWVTPLQPLEPATTYRLVVVRPPTTSIPSGLVDLSYMETVAMSSTPAGGRDVTPPRLQGFQIQPGRATDNCGPLSASASLLMGMYQDDFANGGGILQLDLLADGYEARLFIPPWPNGSPSFVGIGPPNNQGSDCLGNLRVPGGEVGKPYAFELRAWDFSGNSNVVASGTLTLDEVPPPSYGPPPNPIPGPSVSPVPAAGANPGLDSGATGCSVGRGTPTEPAATFSFFALILSLVLRRRRQVDSR